MARRGRGFVDGLVAAAKAARIQADSFCEPGSCCAQTLEHHATTLQAMADREKTQKTQTIECPCGRRHPLP